MTDVRVTSWNELNDALFEGAWKPSLGRYRSDCAFRGMSSAGYSLETSLMRLGEGYARLEAPLLRTFQRYAQRYVDVEEIGSIWNWLALAQHHGLPTRLLDWTFSPYVALHFATERLETFDEDGVIWSVDYIKVQQFLPDPLREILDEEEASVFTVEMLARGAESLSAFDRLSERDFVAFLEPPSIDDRIVNQFALLSFISNPQRDMAEWLSGESELVRRIIIPASLKWEIRDKLDQVNITERVLYPGLDGLTRWLKRYYTPSGAMQRLAEQGK